MGMVRVLGERSAIHGHGVSPWKTIACEQLLTDGDGGAGA
jgi:hypothetical protein